MVTSWEAAILLTNWPQSQLALLQQMLIYCVHCFCPNEWMNECWMEKKSSTLIGCEGSKLGGTPGNPIRIWEVLRQKGEGQRSRGAKKLGILALGSLNKVRLKTKPPAETEAIPKMLNVITDNVNICLLCSNLPRLTKSQITVYYLLCISRRSLIWLMLSLCLGPTCFHCTIVVMMIS